ncbi:MFS transporter [Polymorphobacter sp.]|uniref:MFS transporter n=1 Tax=Polymorphobacter sp. TaxID=1909290 RepID=UPI003F70E8B6
MPARTAPDSLHARWTLWLVVFVDLIGFGILAPLVPFYAMRTGLTPAMITLVIAAYSLCQFAAMPLWGHISDTRGRRPVLLVSMAGHAVSYAMLGIADSWPMLLLARVLGGVTSANLVTAYAYITDVTPPADRAKAMGRISAAFGLGFVVGPALGGLLAGGTSVDDANLLRPALAAGGLSLVSFIGILLFLPESHHPGAADPGAPRRSLLKGFSNVLARPVLAGLVAICIMVITFVAAREAIFAIWAHDEIGLSPRQIGLLLGVSGGTISLFQFFAMGPLARRFGSFGLVQTALSLYVVAFGSLIFATSWLHVGMATVVAAIATALFQTNMQTLISAGAQPHERGMVMGVYQGSSSLARFGGQAVAGSMFAFIGPNAPFAAGAAMMVPAFLLLLWVGRRLRAEADTDLALAEPDIGGGH